MKENKLYTIGALGRFTSEKGFSDLLIALSLLNKENINFKAIIGGCGENKNQLKLQSDQLELDKHVTFPGWIEDKKKFFSEIDIFCLPSRSESFGIVLLEAMKFKTPIVSTDCEGPEEILTDKTDSIITIKNNPIALAESLKYLLTSDEISEKLALNAYNKLISVYSKRAVCRRLEETLADITDKSSRLNILNITHSRKWGGLEQAFIDYASCLENNKHKVVSIVSNKSKISGLLKEKNMRFTESHHIYKKYGQFSLLSQIFYKKLFRIHKPDVILLHNARCLKAIKMSIGNNCPIVVISHGANEIKNCGAEYVIAVNNKIRDRNIATCPSIKKAYTIPNMVDI
ncbi:MAG: glycosyltransferase [Candidatus Sedimenticola sp. (ex Thyasira tokunagai)]